ncbi:Uncharacterised protein [Klebsiella quasipneumoniae]|uniref:hypothetical protein n=1 Tax=Klebsiella quasipneumoniae TaxID=1463165 RepID=UPI0010E1C638|nr:hypothetical protein [Klebsiella quasipneumoniae]SSD82164.1 Uncharacterised protein [Klebsiella quasipneumoniae]
MKIKSLCVALSAVLAATTLSGCCTIVDGKSQEVAIKTNAPAMYTIRNDDGQIVSTGLAPANVSLKRGDAPFTVTLQRTDSAPIATGVIHDNANGWVWGNIMFGGIIGGIIVYSDGAAWDLDTAVTVNTLADPNNPNGNAQNTMHVVQPTQSPITINNSISNKA